jgi:hypothetical protein
MKEKPPKVPVMDEKPVRTGDRDGQATGPEQTMHAELQPRKARGRLSREDQRRLGDVLQRVYDDVLKQGVPDRFKDLIDQISRSDGTSEETGSRIAGADRGVQAKGSDKSRDQS